MLSLYDKNDDYKINILYLLPVLICYYVTNMFLTNFAINNLHVSIVIYMSSNLLNPDI